MYRPMERPLVNGAFIAGLIFDGMEELEDVVIGCSDNINLDGIREHVKNKRRNKKGRKRNGRSK